MNIMLINYKRICLIVLYGCIFSLSHVTIAQKKNSKKKIEALKKEVAEIVESNHTQSQIMVDKIFSFSELGFQEIESSLLSFMIIHEKSAKKGGDRQFLFSA